MTKKRFRLTELDLDRVDIVDVGANQNASIVIAKGMPDGGDVHEDSTEWKVPAERVLRGKPRPKKYGDKKRSREMAERIAGKYVAKAGAMNPPAPAPQKRPAPPVAQPTPAAPKPAPTGGATPPQPMAPGGGLGQGAPPMDPMAMGATPGQPRLQKLTPDQFEMTQDSQTYKEWSLKPDQMPPNMEAVVLSMMSDGDGARYQWMIDPLDGPPISGQSKTAPEAMMALRESMTSHVATSAMQFMGGAAPVPGAMPMPAPGAPAAPGASPAGPAAPGGGDLLARLREKLAGAGKAPAPAGGAPASKPAAPKPAAAAKPAPASAAPPAPSAPDKQKLRKALDLIATDFAEMDIIKAEATGEDLRDILSSSTLDELTSYMSAEASADVEGAHMPNIDIDALAAQLPDEVLDYIETLEADNERLAAVTKSVNPAILGEDAIAKALDTLPPEVAAIVKADRERTERLEKALADERVAKADAVWIAKARSLDGVVDAPDEFGASLRSLAEFDADLADTVFKALEIADRRLSHSNLFTEFGKAGGTVSDVDSRVLAIAKTYQAADPTISLEVARAMAYENHPDVYVDYLAERQGR